jgi:hypothetical protein
MDEKYEAFGYGEHVCTCRPLTSNAKTSDCACLSNATHAYQHVVSAELAVERTTRQC